jgi:peptidoglycan hydrolase CwlO-like protein
MHPSDIDSYRDSELSEYLRNDEKRQIEQEIERLIRQLREIENEIDELEHQLEEYN